MRLPLPLGARTWTPVHRQRRRDLLRRTLGIDLFTCPCGGRRRIVAFITSEEVARKVLGLRPRVTTPPQQRPTGPPQQLALALP